MQHFSPHPRQPLAGRWHSLPAGHLMGVHVLLVMIATAGLLRSSNALIKHNTLHEKTQPSHSMLQVGRTSTAVETGSMPAHATLASRTLDRLHSVPASSNIRSSRNSSSRGSGRSLQAVLQGGDTPVTRYAFPHSHMEPSP
jgi:hypothetical protein